VPLGDPSLNLPKFILRGVEFAMVFTAMSQALADCSDKDVPADILPRLFGLRPRNETSCLPKSFGLRCRTSSRRSMKKVGSEAWTQWRDLIAEQTQSGRLGFLCIEKTVAVPDEHTIRVTCGGRVWRTI
jgi:hypothetical protein